MTLARRLRRLDRSRQIVMCQRGQLAEKVPTLPDGSAELREALRELQRLHRWLSRASGLYCAMRVELARTGGPS